MDEVESSSEILTGGFISSAVITDLRNLLTGPILRRVMGIVDKGESFWATFTAESDIDSDKRDVLTWATDILNSSRVLARLYAPAGILWSLPKKDDGAVVVQPRGGSAPGGAIAMAVGGNGSDAKVPEWLDANNDGLETNETLHLKSLDGDVKVDCGSGDQIQLGSSSLKDAARNGDTVDCGTVSCVVGGPGGTNIQAITFSNPGGTPFTLAIASLGPFTLTGKISQGSAKVKIE